MEIHLINKRFNTVNTYLYVFLTTINKKTRLYVDYILHILAV